MMITPKRTWLPIAGIIAFSLCSVNALAHLFIYKAGYAAWVFWPAAVLVEIMTAWMVWNVVENARKTLKARGKADRKFYAAVTAAFTILSLLSLSTSVIANRREFGHDTLMGFLFPTLSVGCAIGSALPDVVRRREKKSATDKEEAARKKEARRKEREAQTQAEAKIEQLGAARATFLAYQENPGYTQREVADTIGKSATAVRNHLKALEEVGAIIRKDGKVEVLWQK